jgi:hypothetical protein
MTFVYDLARQYILLSNVLNTRLHGECFYEGYALLNDVDSLLGTTHPSPRFPCPHVTEIRGRILNKMTPSNYISYSLFLQCTFIASHMFSKYLISFHENGIST